VLGRVMRGGLRLPRTPYMSDTLYQLMLACWMNDPDERPDWAAVNATLNEMVSDPEQVTTKNKKIIFLYKSWLIIFFLILLFSGAGNN
jgi:hypothetical protein